MIDEKKLIEQLCLKSGNRKWMLNDRFAEGIDYGLRTAIEVVEKLPKVGEWIPCSERLPSYGDKVLASVDVFKGRHPVTIIEYGGECFWTNGTILAWMPLPEPYKGEC